MKVFRMNDGGYVAFIHPPSSLAFNMYGILLFDFVQILNKHRLEQGRLQVGGSKSHT